MVTDTLRQFLRRLRQPKQLAILEACLIGLVAGLAAAALTLGVGWVGSWRLQLIGVLPALVVLPIFGCLGGGLAGWLVERETLDSSGGGLSQVKAVLARVPLPMDLRVAVIKLISATIAIGSGLALGREGPTVQVSAALAAQLSRWFPTLPDYRRQLIAAGAGAGLAAAFNAPIAGVLFVVEELLHDVSGATLGTAILASFIGSSLARLVGGNSLDVTLNVQGPPASFAVLELPFYLLLGLVAGVFGAYFNRGILASLNWYERYLPIRLPWRIALAGLVSGTVIALLPSTFYNNAGLRQILLIGDTDWQIAALAFATQFLLILVAYGSGAPGGLLVRSLLLGAACGYCVGSLESGVLGLGSPTTYARVGMGAFMSASAKVPITAIVTVFEITRDFNLVLPLMITTVVAYSVSERVFSGSLYEKILGRLGIYLKTDEAEPVATLLAQLTADDVMQRRVETLTTTMTIAEVAQAFAASHHRGFPVLEAGRLVGIISQGDMANLQQLSPETSIRELMTPDPITAEPRDSLADILYLLNRYNLSRLPVTKGRKLVGIITRSDIIRAESNQLSGVPTNGPRAEPSYSVYHTRDPAVGQGRILVPIANPATLSTLLQLAIAIARDRRYEIECLQVIIVSRTSSPAEATVRTTRHRRLLIQAERLCRQQGVPVHTQIRVAHEVAPAILETIKQRHIDLVLMGWQGGQTTPGRIFGSVVDTVVRQAPSDVILVKLPANYTPNQWHHWLVPTAGGPNTREALLFLPALTTLSDHPQVQLCQVIPPDEPLSSIALPTADFHQLKQQVEGSVSLRTLRSDSVPQAVLGLAKTEACDVIILGASRDSLLEQVLRGNIPEAIARNSPCTTILVRGPL